MNPRGGAPSLVPRRSQEPGAPPFLKGRVDMRSRDWKAVAARLRVERDALRWQLRIVAINAMRVATYAETSSSYLIDDMEALRESARRAMKKARGAR